MPWSSLGAQFLLEVAFGVLLAMCFVPRAPVGAFFYRLMGGAAVAALLAAMALLIGGGGSVPSTLAVPAGAAILASALYARAARGSSWGVGVAVGLAGTATAVCFLLAAGGLSSAELALASATALAAGAVAGGVGLAMVLGHWYLTVPKLSLGYLRRLNRVTVGCMLVAVCLAGLSLLLFGGRTDPVGRPLLGPTGLFYLGTRIVVGLLFPLGFAWMAHSSLDHGNTRSATGILYASTVLVLIGAAVSIAIQGSYGIPL